MDSDIGLFGIVIGLVAVIIALVYNTQKPLTVNEYVVNTYLYILLAILILSLTMVIIDKYHLIGVDTYTGMKIFCVFIVTIIALCAILMISPRHVILRHILWVVFIVCLSVMLFPLYAGAKDTGVLWKSLVTVILIVLALTWIASQVPVDYFNSWGTYLSVALLALIIFEVLDLLFSDPGASQGRIKIYAIIAIIIFSGFVLYDTNKVYQNAAVATVVCKDVVPQSQCTDYVGESLGLFLDIVNLFANVTTLQQI